MTLHTFQGQSAGPVDEGQPKNPVDRIIVDPGTRSFEGSNPGLLYMAASRPTTMGTGSLDSAIYFTGPNMNRSRVLDIKYQASGRGSQKKLYKKVALREKWVARLDENTVRPKYDRAYVESIKRWCHTFKMTEDELDNALSKKGWRSSMRKGVNF